MMAAASAAPATGAGQETVLAAGQDAPKLIQASTARPAASMAKPAANTVRRADQARGDRPLGPLAGVDPAASKASFRYMPAV